MKKYQEALNYLVGYAKKYKSTNISWQYMTDLFIERDRQNLQKLVDKATPMKPFYREFMRNTPQHEFRESCPNCNNVFDYDELGKKYCGNCGQRIDWGKHE